MRYHLIAAGFSLLMLGACITAAWWTNYKFDMCMDTGRDAATCMFVVLIR